MLRKVYGMVLVCGLVMGTFATVSAGTTVSVGARAGGDEVTTPTICIEIPGSELTAPGQRFEIEGQSLVIAGRKVYVPGFDVEMKERTVVVPDRTLCAAGMRIMVPEAAAEVTLTVEGSVRTPEQSVFVPGSQAQVPGFRYEFAGAQQTILGHQLTVPEKTVESDPRVVSVEDWAWTIESHYVSVPNEEIGLELDLTNLQNRIPSVPGDQ